MINETEQKNVDKKFDLILYRLIDLKNFEEISFFRDLIATLTLTIISLSKRQTLDEFIVKYSNKNLAAL